MRLRPAHTIVKSTSKGGWSSRLACLAFALVTAHVQAAEPWQVLPPTPSLPRNTQGKSAPLHGVRIWYAQWNQRESKTPVLLLHGGYGNSNYFGHLIQVLVAHGYRVIAMDIRARS